MIKYQLTRKLTANLEKSKGEVAAFENVWTVGLNFNVAQAEETILDAQA